MMGEVPVSGNDIKRRGISRLIGYLFHFCFILTKFIQVLLCYEHYR